MTRSRPFGLLAAAAVPLVTLALAGCGGQRRAPRRSVKPASGSYRDGRVANTGARQVLVDSQGQTLYLFAKDPGTTSTCSRWTRHCMAPALASGKPTAGGGAKAGYFGATSGRDGDTQVTYDGHPLYLYVGDQKPGDTSGQGITAFGAGFRR